MSIENLSVSDLEKALAKKRQEEQRKLEHERESYERNRDASVKLLHDRAKSTYVRLLTLKKAVEDIMEELAGKLEKYGKFPVKSKGGFSITNSDGDLRITRTRATQPYWDERSQKAVQLIKAFLHDTVKKRDQKIFEMLISFIEKNKSGDLEYNKVMTLLTHKDKWDDPRWQEGLRLIQESYSNNLKGFGYEFKRKNESGHWESFNLNFSSI